MILRCTKRKMEHHFCTNTSIIYSYHSLLLYTFGYSGVSNIQNMHVVRLECLPFYDIVREFLLHRNCSRHFSVCVKSEGSAQKNIFLISHSFSCINI